VNELLKKYDFSLKLDEMFGKQGFEIISGFATSYGFYTRGRGDDVPSAFKENCFNDSLQTQRLIPFCVDHDMAIRIGWVESVSSINLGIIFKARVYHFPALFELRPPKGFTFSVGAQHQPEDVERTDRGELVLKAIISEISLLTKHNPADIFCCEILLNTVEKQIYENN